MRIMCLHWSVFILVAEIRLKGKNASNTYEIPDEHSFSEEIILEQLQIMDTLFPSTTVRKVLDVAEKRNASDDGQTNSPAKRQKTDNKVNNERKDPQVETKNNTKTSDTSGTSNSDKKKTVNNCGTKQPTSRIEFKESIKRAFQSSKADNPAEPSKPVNPASSQPSSSSSKVTRDIHQYISVVNPKGQMQKKLEQAAPYNFFLTTVTDSKQTHQEPLSITFLGE